MFEFKTSLVRLVVGGIFLPVIVPWLVYRVIYTWQFTNRCREKLENKVVLLTGASSGLGEALALELFKAGARLILASRRLDELERVKNRLVGSGSKCNLPGYPPDILFLDLSDLNAIPAKVEEVLSKYGKIDVLINNGGVSYRGNILNTTVEVDVKIMVVNYFGQVALTKAVLPSMILNRGGHVVGISSVQGKIAIPFRSAYSASKHAFQAFFDTLRSETEDNIKVTVISPGYLKTNLSLNAVTGDGGKYGIMDTTTASGLEPAIAAEQIVEAIVMEKEEVILTSWLPYAAILLRNLCPFAYFRLMRQRAIKNQKAEEMPSSLAQYNLCSKRSKET